MNAENEFADWLQSYDSARYDVDHKTVIAKSAWDAALAIGRKSGATEAITKMKEAYPLSGCYRILQSHFGIEDIDNGH